jgi:hypothetical protein
MLSAEDLHARGMKNFKGVTYDAYESCMSYITVIIEVIGRRRFRSDFAEI